MTPAQYRYWISKLRTCPKMQELQVLKRFANQVRKRERKRIYAALERGSKLDYRWVLSM